MDTFTQMAFGAVIGQAGWRHRFGRRALVAGAITALAPDMDVLVQTGDPLVGWLYHRGLSHSIIAGPFFGLAIGLAFWFYYRWRRRRTGDSSFDSLADEGALVSWLWLGLIVFVSHAWLDVLTPYGTQLLAPLSDIRFAVNAMPIIDIVYSLILVAAIIIGLRPKIKASWAQGLAGAAILLSIVWQFHGWDVNLRAEMKARADMRGQGIMAAEIRSYPILLTPWLRRINVETRDEIHVGYWSLTDGSEIVWTKFAKQDHPLTRRVAQTRAYRILYWFARERVFWRVYDREDGGVRIEAHDLRYLRNLPGEPLGSLWGIAQDFDSTGAPLNDADRWTSRPSPDRIYWLFGQIF